MSSTADPARARNLRTVAVLAGLFLLPLAVSFWMYYATDWRPAGSTSHGQLIQPPRVLPHLALHNAFDGRVETNVFADKWTLVYVGNGACDEACRHALYVMRQSRLALNNDMTRVNRVFLVTDECCERNFLTREHPGLMVLDATEANAASIVTAFPAQARRDSLFIVDPLGNLMMRYDARDNPKGLLEDLKKLLKLSHIG